MKLYVPLSSALETVTTNVPPEFAVAVPTSVEPTNNLIVLFASALPVNVGVLSAAPLVADKLSGVFGAVVSCCCCCADIGLLFQVADDLIDYKGNSLVAGKKTGKDKKKGKATLISLLGYKNSIKYCDKIISDIDKSLKKYGSKSKNMRKTLEYILNRNA